MEDSKPLSVESFSYSWLVNQNSSLDIMNCSFRASFDAADGASFIEMDPNLTPSKRFLVHQEFNFDVPTSQPSTTFFHADNLISNGIIVPVKSSNFAPAPLSSTVQEHKHFSKSRSLSLSKCNKLPKRIIKKYIDLVRPLWCRMRRGRSDSSKVQGVENWECLSTSGPRISGEYYRVDNRRRSSDSETSIQEAVVHCKKTIGME
ncbi:probable membrane-associated kinase regulator 6 [Rutidosis leptorrhynchoides]|uniref:probable membrane-associated kinase regulator 6 n=1 Tax=Rutidosis leptorrhynchoides TaxID=125765 RepID=UPI003A997819